MLCTENCELINFINDKLNGKLESKKLNDLQVLEKNNGGNVTYNITQVIKQEATWEGQTQW
jgi:hypothetical protein